MPPAASGRDRPRDRPEAAGDDGFASLVALPEADGVALPEADGAVDKPAQGGILPAAQSAGARGSGWRSADYPTAEGRRVSPSDVAVRADIPTVEPGVAPPRPVDLSDATADDTTVTQGTTGPTRPVSSLWGAQSDLPFGTTSAESAGPPREARQGQQHAPRTVPVGGPVTPSAPSGDVVSPSGTIEAEAAARLVAGNSATGPDPVHVSPGAPPGSGVDAPPGATPQPGGWRGAPNGTATDLRPKAGGPPDEAGGLARTRAIARPDAVEPTVETRRWLDTDTAATASPSGTTASPSGTVERGKQHAPAGSPALAARDAGAGMKTASTATLQLSAVTAHDGPMRAEMSEETDGIEWPSNPNRAPDVARRAARAMPAVSSAPPAPGDNTPRQPVPYPPLASEATGADPQKAAAAPMITIPATAAMDAPPVAAVATATSPAQSGIANRAAPAPDLRVARISDGAALPPPRIGPEIIQPSPKPTHSTTPALVPGGSDAVIALSRSPEIGAIPDFDGLGPATAPQALSTPGATTHAAVFAGTGAAVPQQIAQHIAASLPKPVSDMGNGTLELALDPPELGRVRMSLVEVGGVMTLSIVADRPETAELMRRHMDILAQEFSRAGLDAPNVRVGTGWDGSGSAPDRDGAPAAPPDTGPDAETAPVAMHAHTARMRPDDPTRALDLRL